MNYLLSMSILIAIYCILSASLNIIMGYGGMFHMGHGGFFAVGAYTAGIISTNLSAPFLLELLAAGALAAAFGAIIGIPSIKLKGDYIAFCTFAFGMVTFNVVSNWMDVTNGPNGIAGIPRPTILGASFEPLAMYFGLSAIIAAFSMWIMGRMMKAPYGRSIEAVREDDIAAESCGKSVSRIRVQIFCVGSFFAGIAGCLFAHYMRLVDPSSFQTATSFLVVSMVIIGGMASFWGPILGAATITILPELLKFVGIPGLFATQIQNIIYGLILMVVILRRPQGLVGTLKY